MLYIQSLFGVRWQLWFTNTPDRKEDSIANIPINKNRYLEFLFFIIVLLESVEYYQLLTRTGLLILKVIASTCSEACRSSNNLSDYSSLKVVAGLATAALNMVPLVVAMPIIKMNSPHNAIVKKPTSIWVA